MTTATTGGPAAARPNLGGLRFQLDKLEVDSDLSASLKLNFDGTRPEASSIHKAVQGEVRQRMEAEIFTPLRLARREFFKTHPVWQKHLGIVRLMRETREGLARARGTEHAETERARKTLYEGRDPSEHEDLARKAKREQEILGNRVERLKEALAHSWTYEVPGALGGFLSRATEALFEPIRRQAGELAARALEQLSAALPVLWVTWEVLHTAVHDQLSYYRKLPDSPEDVEDAVKE